MDFEQRKGGRTLHLSSLNSFFLDLHETWYAVHWTTYFQPDHFVDFCVKDLEIESAVPAFMRSRKVGNTEGILEQIRPRVHGSDAESIEFLRLDVRGFVLVWEPSTEYERALRENQNVPYTGLMGFGSNVFDPDFGKSLLRRTASKDVTQSSDEIWNYLGFLGNTFKRDNIDPARG